MLTMSPIVFGGNVFGWTLDEAASFDILDAAVDAGLTSIDTADVYSTWVPGNRGGESETIIGKWLKARPGMRDRVRIFTKVGHPHGMGGRSGLSAAWILEAVEGSLSRLGVEAIDLYFSHRPDPGVPHAETLGAYAELLKAGKVKAIGASNFSGAELEEALAVARRENLPAYQVVQPLYNLFDREPFEKDLLPVCEREKLAVTPYFALASGFLTGKYRSEADLEGAKRGDRVRRYLTPRGLRLLDALDAVGARHGAAPSEVAIAWLMAQPGVTAPIASATSRKQVESLARAVALKLDSEDLALLDAAGAQEAG